MIDTIAKSRFLSPHAASAHRLSGSQMSGSQMSGWRMPGLWIVCAFAVVGCGDPIHDSVEFVPTTAEVTLTSQAPYRYEWPLTRDGYLVAKPPQMSYVTSFPEQLSSTDPVGAKLVEWSEELFDEKAKQFLHEAYGPVPDRPNVIFSLSKNELSGPQAFDLSVDGEWLAVLSGKELAFYKTKDGSLKRRLKLPPVVASASAPIDIIRLCMTSIDILVASPNQIFRINGESGEVVAQTKGCGDSIAQWILSDDDKSMLVRSESGKLYGGSPNLDYFSAYSVGNDLTFDDASMSPDGSRIGVCIDGIATTYDQEKFQIVSRTPHHREQLQGKVLIACGANSDAWAGEQMIIHTAPNGQGSRQPDVGFLLWRPLLMSMCVFAQNSNWVLIVGSRHIDGKEQTVLFDYDAILQNHSLPVVLDEIPIRVDHGRRGGTVALFDSKGLSIFRREIWRSGRPILLANSVYDWIDQDKLDLVERLLQIVKTQTRLGYGSTSEELRTIMIRAIGDRWRYLTENEPDSEILARLETWRKGGSQLALVSNGLRHYRLAWNARGNGMGNTVTQQGWKVYKEHLTIARTDLDRAIAMGDAPLVAFRERIHTGLELDEELDDVDPICRQACEMYPGELEPHNSIIFKLLPQWYGEPGDAISFALSVSKMLTGSAGDLQYLRFVAEMPRLIGYENRIAWKSYDYNRVKRGLNEYIRRGVQDKTTLWMLWTQIRRRTRDQQTSDRIVRHLMAHQAVAPKLESRGYSANYLASIRLAVEKIRAE